MFPFGNKNGGSTQAKKRPSLAHRPGNASPQRKRRGPWLSLTFATRGSVAAIEDWLRHHCVGEWNLAIEGMGSDLRSKQIRVNFDRDEDRRRFKTAFFAPSANR